MSFLFRESYVMAPFPEVMLRVRFGSIEFLFRIRLSVYCVLIQLTDNVRASTAGAVEKFLDACRDSILQANTRTVEQALEMSANITNVTDIFSIEDDVGSQTINVIDMTCPACQNDTQYAECCGNGLCEDAVCKCNEGWCKIQRTAITFALNT